MSKRFELYKQAIQDRESQHRLRSFSQSEISHDPATITLSGKSFINASSNDYLNLSTHPQVIQAAQQAAESYGLGATAARFISGTRYPHLAFEKELANFQNREASINFTSGYLSNLALLQALGNRNAGIYIDKLAHHSLTSSAIHSGATVHRFFHNDLNHLEKLLSKHPHEQKIILSEAVFSMDGDQADIDGLAILADKYDAILYIDEAHSFGLYGKQGAGLSVDQPRVDIVGSMFGKTLGGVGGALAGSDLMMKYITNYAGAFIFTTAPSPVMMEALRTSLHLIPGFEAERTHLHQISSNLRAKLQALGFDTLQSNSQIIPVVIGTEQEVLDVSMHLRDHGVFVGAIRPPTVAEGTSRIRISLTAAHTPVHVDHIVEAFHSWLKTRKR
jgi:8-amino-7-oxononanoate synthase